MTGTPLNSAASGRHADVARLLLDAGADPDARQASGWTPLHSAAHNGDLELVELLLARGADPAATNDDGATVLSMAEEGGNADVVARVRAALGPERRVDARSAQSANANSCATESHGFPRPNVTRMSVTSATHQKHVTEPAASSLGVPAQGVGRVLVVRQDLAQPFLRDVPSGRAASSSSAREYRIADRCA